MPSKSDMDIEIDLEGGQIEWDGLEPTVVITENNSNVEIADDEVVSPSTTVKPLPPTDKPKEATPPPVVQKEPVRRPSPPPRPRSRSRPLSRSPRRTTDRGPRRRSRSRTRSRSRQRRRRSKSRSPPRIIIEKRKDRVASPTPPPPWLNRDKEEADAKAKGSREKELSTAATEEGRLSNYNQKRLNKLARYIKESTADCGLPGCIKNLNRVCRDLKSAVDDALAYAKIIDTDGHGAINAIQNPSKQLRRFIQEYYICTDLINKGVESLHTLSTTARGASMRPAASVLRLISNHKNLLFSKPKIKKFDNWVRTSRVFAALLADDDKKVVKEISPPVAAPAVGGDSSKAVVDIQTKEHLQPENKSTLPVSVYIDGSLVKAPSPASAGDQDVDPIHVHNQEVETTLVVESATNNENLAHVAGIEETGIHSGSPAVDNLLRQGKLCLVLDLDHTLVNSVMFYEVGHALHNWLDRKVFEESQLLVQNRTIFRIDELNIWTKLRPGVHEFLRQSAEKFELWIHTNGNPAYAASIAKILDPSGRYFGSRIIAQGSMNPNVVQYNQMKRLEEGLAGRDPITVVVDDTHSIWSAHSRNLIPIERYIYFPSSRANLNLPGPSLLDLNRDEDLDNGMLMITLKTILRLHESVFHALKSPPNTLPSGEIVHKNWDVRHVLSDEKARVLEGCRLVFSRIIPLDQDPKTHELWRLAEDFGATCCTQMDESVTHLVAATGKTEKVAIAKAMGIFVVNPAWVESSCLLWKRGDEALFALENK